MAKLTPEALEAINSYLGKLAVLFGVTNVLAILVGFGYIFFVLPGQAASAAKTQIEEELGLLRQEATKNLAGAVADSGKALARVAFVEEQMSGAQTRMTKLQEALTNAEQMDPAKLGKIAEQLDPQRVKAAIEALATALETQQQTSTLVATHEAFVKKSACKTMTWGDCDKSGWEFCPAGYVVVAIRNAGGSNSCVRQFECCQI